MKFKHLLSSALLIGVCSTMNIGTYAQSPNGPFKHHSKLLDYVKYKPIVSGKNLQSNSALQRPTGKDSRLVAWATKKYDGVMFIPIDSMGFYWGNQVAPDNYEWEIMKQSNFYGTMYYDLLNDPALFFGQGHIEMTDLFKEGDSVEYYLDWDNVLSEYTDKHSYVFTLNGAGQTAEIVYFNNGIKSARTLITYTVGGQATSIVEQYWDGVVWENDFRRIASYNTNGDFEEYYDESWVLASSSWKKKYKSVYNYDGQGNVTFLINQRWDDVTTNWKNNERFVFSYTGNLYDNFIRQNWDGVAWNTDFKAEITGRNSNGKVTTALISEWDGAAWVPESKFTYTFDGAKYTSFVIQKYDGILWKYNAKGEYAYDGELLKNITYAYWNDVNSQMENDDRIVYEYNSNDKVSNATKYHWDGVVWNVQKWGGSRLDFYYEEVDGIDTNTTIRENALAQNLVVYPNPAKDQLNLKLNSGTIQSVQIVDVMGKVVFSSQAVMNAREVNIPTAQLANGTYFLNINNAINKAFVVQR